MIKRIILGGAGALLLLWAGMLMVEYPSRETFVFRRPAMICIPAGRALLGSREFPQGPVPAFHELPSFWISQYEITVNEFAEFLNHTGNIDYNSPQVRFLRGKHRPEPGQARRPVAYVSPSQALAYASWLGKRHGVTVRLPSEPEWEFAARGGIERARFPWGWARPAGRACFNATSSRPVGSFMANPFGLHDMAGNLFEWCAGDGAHPVARGGSWAERDPELLRVFHRECFPAGYRDADVGFRVVAEPRNTRKGTKR